MIKCPKCHYEWQEENDIVEKEYNRIERKKKREIKELRAQYMKDIRDGNTTLEFDEWQEYQKTKKEMSDDVKRTF